MPDNKTILDLVNSNTNTILWFTEDSLSRETRGFTELNYIFDGLISQVIFAAPMNLEKNTQVFFTKNFEQQLCLIHFTAPKTQSSDLDEHIAFLGTRNNQKNEILILDFTKSNWIDKLSKRYTQFRFYGQAHI